MAPSEVGRWAKVVAVHPEAHAVDLVMLDTGAQLPMVTVLSASLGTDHGDVGLAEPTAPPSPYSPQATGQRDVWAAVVYIGNLPAVIGFKVPEIGQMTFAEKGLKVSRHGSDVYSTVSDDGSFEMAWPNGLWMGVQTAPGHVDRTGTDFDGQWAIKRNTGASYTMTLELPGGAGTIQISPAGALTVTMKGPATIKAPQITLDAPVSCTSTLAVQGAVTGQAGATFQGDVVGSGKSLASHKHLGVQTGTGVTGPPQ